MQTKNINVERAPVNNNNNNNNSNNNNNVPPPEAIIACLATMALSAPVEPVVEVTQDTHGNYRFFYKTEEATREETRDADGHVVGSIEYYDPSGVLRTLHYTSGSEGYNAAGPLVPVPVAELPEVQEARDQHLSVYKAVDSLLPRLNEDGLVDETPIVPLSKEEYVAAVEAILGNGPLVFSEDTAEIAEAKIKHLRALVDSLGQ